MVEDVTSDVFVDLPQALVRYKEEGAAEHWLGQVAVRRALRAKEKLTGGWYCHLESTSTVRGTGVRSYASFDEQADSIVQLMDSIDAEELLELERRLSALRESADPKKQRWADFVDLYRAGYGFSEIGQRLGITEGTARNWLVSIRQFIAAPLGEQA